MATNLCGGDPLNMDGSQNQDSDLADRFSNLLNKRYDIDIEKTMKVNK